VKRASGYRKHITKRGRELLARKDMQPAIKLFEKATRASRAHSKLVSESMDEYGDQGPQISGIIREHFPTDVKNRLRKLARDINKYADAAYYARPKGVRNTTMQALAGAVATKTGTGFYGPRGENPKRKGTKAMAKKRRTAKQRAATKKMIAANRARLRKKTKTARRKTTGRKKTRRKTRRNPQKARPGLRKKARYSKTSAQSAKRNLYMIFKVSKSGVTYLSTPTPNKAMFRLHKGDAVLFQSKLAAKSVAAAAARRTAAKYGALGVTKYGTPESAIRAHVKGKA